MQADFIEVVDIAFDKNNTLYFLDVSGLLRLIDENGLIKTMAGGGFIDPFDPDLTFDGILATETELFQASSFDIADDGSIVIADMGHECVRHVTTDGYIYTMPGSAPCYIFAKERGGVHETQSLPNVVKFDGQGGVVYHDTYDPSFMPPRQSFVKIHPYGLHEVLNSSEPGLDGDGEDFQHAVLNNPANFIINTDGEIIIADTDNKRIRKVRGDNSIVTVGGADSSLNRLTQLSSNKPLGRYKGGNPNMFISERNGSVIFEFSPNGVHLRTIDPMSGHVLHSFSYDADGLLSYISDENSLVTTINRNADNLAEEIISHHGKLTELTYYPDNTLKQVKDPLQNHWDLEYTDNNLTAFTDRNNNRNEFVYDTNGLINSDLNSIGGGWQFSTLNDVENSSTVTMTSSKGRVFEFFKDKTAADGGTTTFIKTYPDNTQEIRTNSKKSSETLLPDGSVSFKRYTGTERLGNNIKFEKIRTITTSSGLSKEFENNLVEVTSDPDIIAPVNESIKTTKINNHDWVTTFSLGIGEFGGYEFTSPENRLSKLELTANNKIRRASVGNFTPLEFEYDDLGRAVRAFKSSGVNQREYSFTYYNSGPMAGELHTITNPLLEVTTFEYDKNGQTTKLILPDLTEVNYTYDANGNLTSLTPPNRPTYFFEYDGKNNETAYKAPVLVGQNSNETRYEFNTDGQIIKKIKPDGSEIIFNYDATTGLPTTTQVPEGTYTYSYNPITGLIETSTSADGIIQSYEYDSFLPIVSSYSGAVKGNVARTYDSLFRVSSRTVNGSNTVAYEYDNDNFITKAGDMIINLDSVSGIISDTELNNLITTEIYDDSADLVIFGASYNGLGIYDFNIVRDKLSRVISRIETINGLSTTFDYQYNSTGQLIEEKINGVVTTTWEYDSNSNRTHVNGTLVASYDNQDRLLAYDSTVFSYTDNGELATKTNGSDITSYRYNSFGALVHVSDSNGLDIEYLIDTAGRRVAKKQNGVIVKSWVYKDGLNPIAELDASGNVVARYVYGDKENVPSYMIKDEDIYRIISNHLGSPVLVVNTLTGIVEQKLSYDTWGNVLSDTNPEFQLFGFAGGMYDVDTKLTHFGYREYDASIGRWTSQDPIRFASFYNNLYVYLNNEPVSSFDDTGLRVRSPNNTRPNNNGRSNQNNHIREKWELREQQRMDKRRERIETENKNNASKLETFVNTLEEFITINCKIAGACLKDKYSSLCLAYKCGGSKSMENYNQNVQCTANGNNYNDGSFFFGEHDEAIPVMTGPEGFNLLKNNCVCIKSVFVQ